MINTLDRLASNKRFRVGVNILLVALGLLMITLQFVQIWFGFTVSDISGYASIPAEQNGWPRSDQRGAFLVLNSDHSGTYQSNLVQLLAVSEPGAVPSDNAPHFKPNDIQSILVQSAALGEPSDYVVYRDDTNINEELKFDRQPGGKVLLLTPHLVRLQPGAYQMIIPADGMFGGSTFFQFYVDAE